VFALEQRYNFLLCRGLLGVCGVERMLGGINGGSAAFDEILWAMLAMADARSLRIRHTLLLDLSPQCLDTRVVGTSVGVDLVRDYCKLR
jgi:hypothetical protein